MKQSVMIRNAEKKDIPGLLALEEISFKTDRLSKRSFSRFVKSGPHLLLVLGDEHELFAYALALLRSGTKLARLYSIAVSPQHQGKGYAKKLIQATEEAVRQRHAIFMRLEVNVSNRAAIMLYENHGYNSIGLVKNYYEDGADALRMEKHLGNISVDQVPSRPYYQQTTDFTCGPSSLMMALKSLDPNYSMNRHEELKIWREATTIFMTSGHGGCSPYGLALSANQRGFNVSLYINQEEAPFLDGVRDEDKKKIIKLVHDDFLAEIKSTNIQVFVQQLDKDELNNMLDSGKPILALISTWQLNRNKAPHWVFVTHADGEFVYINDPDIDDEQHLGPTDYINVPIEKPIFWNIARFGQKRLRCLLLIS